ncbi:3-alpha--hydroxysteroid dehydrogenase [Aaosphaeria arxii CBS 175.79]|uniref:3-alpha--hydroxysteroid dehydrogenase n=1 Tax=Aaosphaeria arxii CBS 175.79 TaxID=1450172 RepID=A0A6A5XMN2_9PLEO|nr:3-alpha--hydroxysteroid dehydrogenase [Aaosphaeria arxii CBS 175.79]KAF2014505.1 3-alpha--hydroxysteroid dehydrogenase [Aaosphaeria arxii CBS 175.79]
MSLKDKVIVITGAASGMGLETARLLASRGAKLSLADVQERPLREIESELSKSGAQVMARVVDVSKRGDVESWIEETVRECGKLDGAANLAGVIGRQNNTARIEDIDDGDWDFIMGVNAKGLLHCLRAQIPNMRDGGSIVNAASILGLIGSKKSIAYVASKHAVVGMTRAAAKECGERNIRVNCFCPGPIDTPMFRQSAEIRGTKMDTSFLALGRAADQKEVPPLIEFLLSDAASFITGNAMPIDGGWYC